MFECVTEPGLPPWGGRQFTVVSEKLAQPHRSRRDQDAAKPMVVDDDVHERATGLVVVGVEFDGHRRGDGLGVEYRRLQDHATVGDGDGDPFGVREGVECCVGEANASVHDHGLVGDVVTSGHGFHSTVPVAYAGSAGGLSGSLFALVPFDRVGSLGGSAGHGAAEAA